MAERSSFFDAVFTDGVPDVAYNSTHYAEYFGQLLKNGVFNTSSSALQVMQSQTSYSIDVQPGNAFLNGYLYINDSIKTISVDVADGTLARKDIIVAGLNLNNRNITTYLKKGTPSGNPVAPSLTRDDIIYEIQLAEITVRAAATNIFQSDISDSRGDNTKCGFVTGFIDQLDTTTLWNQYQDQWDQWFEGVKDQTFPNKQNVITLGTSLPSTPATNDVHFLDETNGVYSIHRYDGTSWIKLFTNNDTTKIAKPAGAVAGDRLKFDGTNWVRERAMIMERIDLKNDFYVNTSNNVYVTIDWKTGQTNAPNYNPTTMEWTVPASGWYEITGDVLYYNATANNAYMLRVTNQTTGEIYSIGTLTAAGYYAQVGGSYIEHFNAGDRLVFQAYATPATYISSTTHRSHINIQSVKFD